MKKVKGFNPKEQLIVAYLHKKKAPLHIKDLMKLFNRDAIARCKEVYESGWGEIEVSDQSQSYVRNSIRRPVRDGWVKQIDRGTYQMTAKGISWVEKEVTITASALASNRGKLKPQKAKKVTKKAKKATKKAKKTTKKATKKAPAKSSGKPAVKTTKKNGKSIKAKIQQAKQSALKEMVYQKVSRVQDRLTAEQASA